MSSIPSVSWAGYVYQPTRLQGSDPLIKSLQAVSTALQSGNVSEAQSALSKFQKELQGNAPAANTQAAASQPFGSNSRANSAYQNLVSAVKTGDLSVAEQALTSLKTDLRGSKTPSSNPSSPVSSGLATQDLRSIGSALQTGNLSSALSKLTSIQTSSFADNTQASSAYQNLVEALQSGNLLAAQQAYTALNGYLS
jgi:hypothetical protein